MRKNYLIGCSGWFYLHWQGKFYPQELKTSQWFDFYSKKFGTVEINSSFYHFPQEKTVKNWAKKAPADFTYTVKANRFITHIKKFKKSKKLVKDFYKVTSHLEEKLGAILFQLPPSLHFKTKKLEEIVSQLNPEKENVLEFRHDSWWNQEVYDKLKENNIAFCVVSAPQLPEDVKITAKHAYFRFHGKKWYATNYSKKELKDWAEKMKKTRAKKVYAYFNNDYNAFAPKNALQLKKILKVK